MTARAYIKHECPGRLRMSFPEKAHDEEFFCKIVDHLRYHHPEIKVKSNPLTGSILLTLDQKSDLRETLRLDPKDREIFELDEEISVRGDPSLPVTFSIEHFIKFFDRLIRDFSGNRFDLKTVTGVALVGLSAFQYRKGNFLPAGLTLVLNALGVFGVSKNREGDE